MKYKYIVLLSSFIVVFMFITAELIGFSAGAPTNASGSPGNNNLTCVQCHASNNNEKLGWITSTELADGWSPTVQYNIKAKAEKPACTKFGFLITVEKPDDGTKTGVPVVTDAARTQVQNTNYITHTSTGTAGQDSAVWMFRWTAPSSPMGTVCFYGAFIGANGDNQNSGDIVYVSRKVVIQYGTQGIAHEENLGNKLYLFPNPADDIINLDLETAVENGVFQIFATSGQLVKQISWKEADRMKVDISALPDGCYLTRFVWDQHSISAKMVVRHW